jgi:hypothetical protein
VPAEVNQEAVVEGRNDVVQEDCVFGSSNVAQSVVWLVVWETRVTVKILYYQCYKPILQHKVYLHWVLPVA